jgi:tRNA splicing endonuclease
MLHLIQKVFHFWELLLTVVVKGIREQYHIVGTPVGTLLQLPTQNIFLGNPFEYSPEEIALLLTQNAILVLDGQKAGQTTRLQRRAKNRPSPYGIFLEFPKEWRRTGRFLFDPPKAHPSAPTLQLSKNIPKPEGILFRVYEYLHNAGLWMTPGLRFGCEFNAYPSDPLRFHSHFMVHVEKDEEVEMLTLVGGGRVATQTRKAWMLAGDVEGDIRVFSIEWAGFG